MWVYGGAGCTWTAAANVRAPVLQLAPDNFNDAERLLEKVLSVLGERKSGRDLPTNFKAVYSQLQHDDRSLAHELVLQLVALLSRPLPTVRGCPCRHCLFLCLSLSLSCYPSSWYPAPPPACMVCCTPGPHLGHLRPTLWAPLTRGASLVQLYLAAAPRADPDVPKGRRGGPGI